MCGAHFPSRAHTCSSVHKYTRAIFHALVNCVHGSEFSLSTMGLLRAALGGVVLALLTASVAMAHDEGDSCEYDTMCDTGLFCDTAVSTMFLLAAFVVRHDHARLGSTNYCAITAPLTLTPVCVRAWAHVVCVQPTLHRIP